MIKHLSILILALQFSTVAQANFMKRLPISEDNYEMCEMNMRIKVSALGQGFDNKNVVVRTLIQRPEDETTLIRVMINSQRNKSGEAAKPGMMDELSVYNTNDMSIRSYTHTNRPTVGRLERKWAAIDFSPNAKAEHIGVVRLIRARDDQFDDGLKDFKKAEQVSFLQKYWDFSNFEDQWNAVDFEQPWVADYAQARPDLRDGTEGSDSTINSENSFLMALNTFAFGFLRHALVGENGPQLFHIGKLKNGPNVHSLDAKVTQLKSGNTKVNGQARVDGAKVTFDSEIDPSTKEFVKFNLKVSKFPGSATWTLNGSSECQAMSFLK